MSIEIGYLSKVFVLSEAKSVLPLVQSITQRNQTELAPIQARLNKMLSNDPRRNTLEQDYEAVVSRWRTKVELLGAKVVGLWMVEFDVGDGCLSWKYPELSLSYFRAQHNRITDRVKLTDYIQEQDPDWAC